MQKKIFSETMFSKIWILEKVKKSFTKMKMFFEKFEMSYFILCIVFFINAAIAWRESISCQLIQCILITCDLYMIGMTLHNAPMKTQQTKLLKKQLATVNKNYNWKGYTLEKIYSFEQGLFSQSEIRGLFPHGHF